MLKDSKAFSSFSVGDTARSKDFYTNVLGLEVTEEPMGNINIQLGSGANVMVYPKGDGHVPAEFTVLTFPVSDIDGAVESLRTKDVTFEHYNTEWIKTDEKGIARSSDLAEAPHMAWFKDPDGNVLALMQL